MFVFKKFKKRLSIINIFSIILYNIFYLNMFLLLKIVGVNHPFKFGRNYRTILNKIRCNKHNYSSEKSISLNIIFASNEHLTQNLGNVSMFILVFLSLERFLLIAVPLSGYQVLRLRTAVYCMVSIWLIGIIIAIAPLILWKHSSKFYGSNGLCYPLYIEDPFSMGWQYSAFMFLGLHTTSLLLMTVLYALIFLSVRETRQAVRISAGDFDFAVRFFFIVLANSLCWLPIIVLKFAALKKYHVSSKMYGWVIVFIVPINALVNPLLYTFTTPKYRNVITSTNILKILHRDSSSGTEMSTSYTFTLFGRTVKKNGRKSIEKTKDKSSTQENSFESTNGE